MKYYILELWNGDGYSYENHVHKVDLKDDNEALKLCLNKAIELSDNEEKVTKNNNGYHYDVGGDNGAFYFIRASDDIIGFELNPNICGYKAHTNKKEWLNLIQCIKDTSEDYQIDGNVFGEVHHAMMLPNESANDERDIILVTLALDDVTDKFSQYNK